MTEYPPNNLFANPSSVEGVSRIFDLGATLQEYNTSKTDSEADIKALSNDWKAVGEDLRVAISRYEQKLVPAA